MTLETANRLFELRKKNGLSQEELAEKLGVSRQAVSKWERSEASPDTDNLIALAKLYGLTLDELIYGKNDDGESSSDSGEPTGTAEHKDDDEKIDKVSIGPAGIFVESKDGEKMKINLSGIKIESKSEGEEWHYEEDEDDDEETHTIYVGNNGHLKVSAVEKKRSRFWSELPYPIICVIAYLICGFGDYLGGWGLSWVIFVTVPVYYSLVEAIYDRSVSNFAYPVLLAFAYLVLGLYFDLWHPGWIIFITIPIYYPIAAALDKKIAEARARKEENN